MPWPDPSAYNEAVQNPQQNFGDSELCTGTVCTNLMGLPIPISGGFATVYQVQCGSRVWAVRCFQREIPDQQQRYAAISQHLTAAHLPYTVGFTYLNDGIRVRGKWFPILKMEWVKGESLNTYIERNLGNTALLQQLASQLLSMAAAIRQANVAHGDLQHGNILVANGNLRLIDYDGMYVPALAGYQSHEIGHRNYQHPRRNAADFGPDLDNFSVWVIYLSIVAVSIDASLWQCAEDGKENLLFHRKDFEDPSASSVLRLLTRHADPRLQGLASLFTSALYADPCHVTPVQSVSLAPQPSVATTPSSTPDWVKDHLQTAQHVGTVTAAQVSTPTPIQSIDWLLDFVSPPQAYKCFTSSLLVPRISLFGLLVAISTVLMLHLVLAVGGGVVGSVVTIVSLIVIFCYGSDPVYTEKKLLLLELRQHTTALAEIQKTLDGIETSRAANLRIQEKDRQALAEERGVLQRKEQQELAQVQTELTNACHVIDTQINELGNGIQRIRADAMAQTSWLQQQLSQLNQTESNEISNTLRPSQQQFLLDYVRRHRIDSGHVPGIGPTIAARLAARGYLTAGDINWGVANVSGIGNSKAASLMGWRRTIEQMAAAAMPRSLSQAQINGIHAKYESQRLQLQQQIDSVARTVQQHEQVVRAQSVIQRQKLEESRDVARKWSQQQAQAITQRYQQEYSKLAQKEVQVGADVAIELKRVEGEQIQARKQVSEVNWRLAKTRRALEPYRRISLAGYMQIMLGIPRRGRTS